MTINNIRNFALAFALAFALVVMPAPAYGQTDLTTLTTTLTARINSTQASFVVGSVTNMAVFANAGPANGGIGSPTSLANSTIMIDKESMVITGINVTAKTITVRRGAGQSAQAHNASAKVWVGPSSAFKTQPYHPAGQCQRSTLPFVPFINVTTGHKFDCLGVTTAGQWFQTDSPGSNLGLIGSTVTPASSITPTGLIFATDSGATTISTIVVPAGFGIGMSITIIPGGTGATDTMGNIGLTTSALVVGRAITFVWSGSKWYPSYVS